MYESESLIMGALYFPLFPILAITQSLVTGVKYVLARK